MDPRLAQLNLQTRRHFLQQSQLGLGAIALSSLMGNTATAALSLTYSPAPQLVCRGAAVVTAANPSFDALSRPIIRIVSDASGNMLVPPLEVDLAQVDGNGDYPRTIIKTADPERYGINIGDYIV